MKKTLFLVGILLIIIVGIYLILNNKQSGLVSSGFSRIFNKATPIPSPTMASPNAPKTFNFDSQTDLKSELEKVNPQVLNSDFE